jgi:hypothetical protein
VFLCLTGTAHTSLVHDHGAASTLDLRFSFVLSRLLQEKVGTVDSLVACGRHTPRTSQKLVGENSERRILNRMERNVVMYARSFDVSTAISHDQHSHETIMKS